MANIREHASKMLANNTQRRKRAVIFVILSVVVGLLTANGLQQRASTLTSASADRDEMSSFTGAASSGAVVGEVASGQGSSYVGEASGGEVEIGGDSGYAETPVTLGGEVVDLQDQDAGEGQDVLGGDEGPDEEREAEQPAEEQKAEEAEAKDSADEKKAEDSAESPSQKQLSAKAGEDKDATVRVDAPAEAKLPDGAKLRVVEVDPESKTYEAYREQALKALGTDDRVVLARFFDISIVKDGEDVQPEDSVQVSIKLPDAPSGAMDAQASVVHFEGEKEDVAEPAGEGKSDVEDAIEADDSKPEDKDAIEADETGAAVDDDEQAEAVARQVPEVIKASEDGGTTSFDAQHFSVYGVVYTVDFQWDVDGQTYEFSLPGGGFVSFASLVEELGLQSQSDVLADDATGEFLADVDKVEFSAPDLLSVSKVEEDTTVGALKERLELDCEYSAELTQDQIDEIDAQEVKAGDWALISIKPFSSEEALTVAMKTGEKFTVKVTDAQLKTYVISDSGDKYEVIVTYDDTAEIPEGAELVVQEIAKDSKKYTENVDLADNALIASDETVLSNPVQFDIRIVSKGVEVEPKKGSLVKVEIRLAKGLFGEEEQTDDGSDAVNAASDELEGVIVFNGEVITADKSEITDYRVAHICDGNHVELIDDVQKTVDEDQLILQFDTESFSDYLFDTTADNGLSNLPARIHVGDEIYMWRQGDMWVTNIGSVVTETKHNNSDGLKTVKAVATGTFRIYNRYNYSEYKEITVLPERTGTVPPAQIQTIDNSSIGLTLNLFDYDLDSSLDSYFNNYNHDDHPVSDVFLNESGSINYGHDLKFWGSGIGNKHGSYNEYNEHRVTNIVRNTTDAGGYPVLSHNGDSLSYLFAPSDGVDKKAYVNVDGLFKKVDDYYVYDSNTNYAWYNQVDNRFEVYERTYEQKSTSDGGEQATVTNGKPIGFFPFHKWDEEYDLYVNWNKSLNHHFGMSMSVDFALPKEPKAVKDSNGNDIVFEFSGDDDMWVFIDGNLAMDIGGIHQPTNGKINFTSKQVIVNGAQQSGFNFDGLYDGEKHTLQVFYIERGGCDSNCMIKFNITRYGDVKFNKVDADEDSENLAGAVFALYRDQACTQPLMEQLNNNTSRAFVKVSNSDGHVEFDGIPLGTYYMKEVSAPQGYPANDRIWTIRVVTPQTNNVEADVYIDDEMVNHGEYGYNVKVLNSKPAPIDLTLEKVWIDSEGELVSSIPTEAKATFELKRIRTYETYTETDAGGNAQASSRLKVGWIHNGRTHIYRQYDMIVSSTATISWGYKNGYAGETGCIKNGDIIHKSNENDVYSEAVTMPAAGVEATFYVIDTSEQGDAITSINVAGREFIGNSGGGRIHEFTRVSEPDPEFSYTSDATNVSSNQVTLPINSQWNYTFENLPLFGVSSDLQKVYNYSYYIEEVSCSKPSDVTVIYKDSQGNVIASASDAETTVSGTQIITNQVNVGSLLITKNVLYNGRRSSSDEEKNSVNGTYKFSVEKDDAEIEGSPFEITVENGLSNEILIPYLQPGQYTIKEVQNPTDLVLTEATGESVSKQNTVTVYVTAGKLTKADLMNNAKATFTNNYTEYEVVIIKTEMGSNNTIRLGGAIFDLYTEDAVVDNHLKENAQPIKRDLVSSDQQDNLGKVSLGKLKPGKYYLVETKAPDGYLMLDTLVEIEVCDGEVSLQQGISEPQKTILQGTTSQDNGAQSNLSETAEFMVTNNPGYVLPSTGGIGTKAYTLVGAAFATFAGVGLLLKRKRKNNRI